MSQPNIPARKLGSAPAKPTQLGQRGPRVGDEISEAWRWLLSRPQRVAAIMASWRPTVDVVADVMREVEKICAHEGVDPADFGKRFDPYVTINVHQRYVIVELRDA